KNEPEAALEVAEAGRTRAFTELLTRRVNTLTDAESAAVSAVTGNISGAPLSIEAMRAIAQRTNNTLVEYALVPEEEFRVQGKQQGRTAAIQIWVISPDGDVAFRQSILDAEVPPLTDLVVASRDAMGVRGRGLDVIQDDGDESPRGPDKLHVLHQLLIEPIQDLLPPDPEGKIVLIPQGDLFLVPFPALLDEAGDRLIQHHTLLTVPSISVLDLTQQRRTRLRGVQPMNPESADWLIVGNPEMPEVWNPQLQTMQQLPTLQGAEREALEVATLFNTHALIGSDASESRVKDRIETAQVVHLATHGLLEYGSVESSGIEDIPGAIALTPEADQDGLLTSAEILNELTLQADLVVLSACDTGRGDITGDGVLGLSRSLIAAGAPSVVVSLWAVPDAPTADLMIKFYAELKQGKDKAQALRQAMLMTMQAYPAPQNWAAFTLIGEAQ
ncbi:MAG: CHAT domain-containing protein, partial [Cyanobacteria bacterium J06559_3]